MKRIVTVLLCVLMLTGAVSVLSAESAPLLQNGSFEAHADNIPEGWLIPVGTPGENFEISDKAQEGKASVRLFGKTENVYFNQEIEGLRNGAKYTLSFYMKRDGGAGITNRIEFTYPENGKEKYLTQNEIITALGESELAKWVKYDIDFTVPPKAEKTVIAFRKVGAGDVYFDGVTISGGSESGDVQTGTEEIEEAAGWQPKAIENAPNLLGNTSFEEEANGFAKDWIPFTSAQAGQKAFLNTDPAFAYSGNNSIKIATQDTTLPWARYRLSKSEDLVPGAECTYSCRVYTPTEATRLVFKCEFYLDNIDELVPTGDGGSKAIGITKEDGWVEMTGSCIIPDNTDTMMFYLRMTGVGEAYFDDVEFHLTKGPKAVNAFLTDEYFYYTDYEGTGSATITSSVDFYPEFVGAPIKWELLDKEMVLYEDTVPMGEDGTCTFEYPLSVMTEMMREYTVRYTFMDTEGNVIDQNFDTVYKVERPNFITEDGAYVENGVRFDPVGMYHIPRADFELAKQIGVNFVQGYPTDEFLDLAAEHGMKCFVVLGSNGKDNAGAPNRLPDTLEMVKKYKDHPAVFGWSLKDEPTIADMQNLKTAYIEIKKIDPNHPIFTTMNHGADTTGRATDFISSDSYPYGLSPFTTSDYKTIDNVVKITKNRRPVGNVLQAFDYRYSFPTEQEIRSMIYQTYWAGAKGHTYYAWSDCQVDEEGNEIPIYNTRLWEPLKSFYALEYQDMLEHFAYKLTPTFNEAREETYWYRSWVKDGKLSLILLNQLDREGTTAEIDLTSADGKVKVGNFTAKVVNGSDEKPVSGTDGKFTVQLAPGQTIKYTITVDCDLSGITSSGFSDMYNHGWAEEAVKTLNEKDILYTNDYTFSPGDTVTRADFAYMLMRALEIPAAEAELFTDVKWIEYYAEELQAGRAAGLLNGFEDGTFGADMPISRQDLMTMCVRAAEYAGKLQNVENADLSAFTDGDTVSDYAKEAVCKMVGAGLIVGNEDGTVNPQGETTRAEAAVILARLMEAA